MKRRVTMRAALADPRLLGNALHGESWATWHTFLIAAMGEMLTDDERVIFQRFTGRYREPGERIEEALFLIGRRGGKDRAAAVLATYLAALVDWSAVLAKGETGLVACIGADTRQSTVQRDYIEGVFDASPLLSKLVVNRTADTIELSNAICIEVRAASFRRLRGVTCIAVIASETAFWQNEESSNPDTEILNAVRPSLATTHGPLILITTPYARRGEVWNTYHRHYGKDGDPLILVAQGTSRDFNPTLSQKVIDRAMERDAPAASAEFLAQFRTDIESFIGRETVQAAVISSRRELPPVSGCEYVAFCDPSGGSADSFTLAIAHADRHQRGVLDCLREVRPPFSPDSVVQEFAATLKSYRLHRVRGDRYGGEWPRERFQAHGITYEVSDQPKSQIYGELLPLLNSGRLELLDHPKLVSQLCSLERRTARSGRDSIDHGPNGHDDIANAVAGCLVLAAAATPSLWGEQALLVNGAAVPMPSRCDAIFVTLIVGQQGDVAILYWALNWLGGHLLILLDVEITRLLPELFDAIRSRLVDLTKTCRSRTGAALFASRALANEAQRIGFLAEEIDNLLVDIDLLVLSAATHICANRVKIAAEAFEKSERMTLGGILDAAAKPDDPVRIAALVGIALALDENRSLGRT
jgi:hypothetical protein